MPGTRTNRALHANTEQVRHALELTNNIIASRGRVEKDDEEICGADEPASPNPRAVLAHRVDSLNSDQRSVYEAVRSDVISGIESKRVVLIGPGGTWKSYLILTIWMTLLLRTMGQADKDASVITRRHFLLVKTALIGVAAANIGGLTLQNTLEIKGRNVESAIPDSSLTRFQRDWKDVAVLVVGDISFLLPAHLYAVSARQGYSFPTKKHLPFAGLCFIMAGYPYQLGPVGGKMLWLRKQERGLSAKELLGREYYLDCDAFFDLTIGQRNMSPFYSMLSRQRL